MADLAVHDDRSGRSRWPDLRVHDAPESAQKLPTYQNAPKVASTLDEILVVVLLGPAVAH